MECPGHSHMGISKWQAHPDYLKMVHALLKSHRLCRMLGDHKQRNPNLWRLPHRHIPKANPVANWLSRARVIAHPSQAEQGMCSSVPSAQTNMPSILNPLTQISPQKTDQVCILCGFLNTVARSRGSSDVEGLEGMRMLYR